MKTAIAMGQDLPGPFSMPALSNKKPSFLEKLGFYYRYSNTHRSSISSFLNSFKMKHHIPDHPCEMVDDEPGAGSNNLSHDESQEEGTKLCIYLSTAIFEDDQLKQPCKKDAKPCMYHR